VTADSVEERRGRLDRGEAAGQAVVAFGGDVILGQSQNALTARDGPTRALGGVPELAEADLAIVNLEGVVANTGAPVAKGSGRQPFHFRGRPELLAVLAAAGIDVVATANNHSGDYGPEALLEQLRLLDGMNLGHVGSGPNREAAWRPALRRAGPLSVAVFAADATMAAFAATEDRPGNCYLSWDDPEAWRTAFAPRIAEARRAAHVVLVVVHCGVDFETQPRPREIALCRALVEAGADAVLNSSSHELQGIEIHRGRPIVYDAGNLLWNSSKRPAYSAVFSLVSTPTASGGSGSRPSRRGTASVARCGGTRAGRSWRPCTTARPRSVRRSSSRETTAWSSCRRRRSVGPPTAPAPPAAPLRSPPPPATAPPPGVVVAEVPAEARAEAVPFGPLVLVGVSVSPSELAEGAMLWIDTYWAIGAPIPDDLWLAVAGRPCAPKAPDWEGDHEPCDWMWPTSRWVPGTIYHDRYGLRPPRRAVTAELDVWLGLRRAGEPVGRTGPWRESRSLAPRLPVPQGSATGGDDGIRNTELG
jgi:poly-gamma-glutamate capsule biosynthesis protein CapA/YwtB (metallophosphatase superfamily)